MGLMKTISRHGPKLLTIGSVVGTVITAAVSYRAGYKSAPIIDGIKADLEKCDNKEDRKKIVINGMKQLIVPVLPAAATTLGTILCGIGSNVMSANQIKTLTNVAEFAVARSDGMYNAIKDKYGEEQANKLRAKGNTECLSIEPSTNRMVYDCGGSIKCCVRAFNIDFISTHEDVELALQHLACMCYQDGIVDGEDLLNLLIPVRHDTPDAAYVYEWHSGMITEDGLNGAPRLPIATTTIMRDDQPTLEVYFEDYTLHKR